MSDRIVLGLWPIAGITTVGVTQDAARDTIAAAIDNGIVQFDTAYSYGYDGESDRLLGEFVSRDRDRFHVMGKVGQRWSADRKRVDDGSPKQLIADAEDSLRRIGIDHFDTLLLHIPDQTTPLEESAMAIRSLQERGLCTSIGVGNVTPAQYQLFASVAGCDAIQCPLNMMQTDSLKELIPSCAKDSCKTYTFWTLMKGFLAGKITRDHEFDPDDVRPNYPIFQGQQRERIHVVVDELSRIGTEIGKTVSQLAVGWVISQPGVTAALVGARRSEQIIETSQSTVLSADVLNRVDQIVKDSTH